MPSLFRIAIALSLLSGCSDEPACRTAADRAPVPAGDAARAFPIYDPATNPFSQPIGQTPAIHPDSDLLVESLIQQHQAQGMLVVVREWSTPVYLADAATPRLDVELIAPWAPYHRLKDVPVPDHAIPDSADDGHMVVIDVDAGLEYDLHQLCIAGGESRAAWGNLISTTSSGVFPLGLSARGSGFALLNGLIRPEELQAGRIDHALLFSFDHTKAGGPVAPATESDGTGTEAFAIPEGARVQLDPALDVDSLGLTAWQATVARALQEYGMILGDDGGGLSLYAVSPMSYAEGEAIYDGLLDIGEAGYASFGGDFPRDRFRVLEHGPQDPDWSETADVEFRDRFE